MVRMPASPERRCQCSWQPHHDRWGQFVAFIPCFQDMTQEDLICDYCRLNAGCTHGHERDTGFA